MPFTITCSTDFQLAIATFPTFTAVFCANVLWTDPFPTSLAWTIYAVLRRIFLIFSVPLFLEL